MRQRRLRPLDVLALGDALDALATVSPRAAQVVELRFFGGFSVQETAETLGISSRTVINDWNAAAPGCMPSYPPPNITEIAAERFSAITASSVKREAGLESAMTRLCSLVLSFSL
jgi:hypothetical protein